MWRTLAASTVTTGSANNGAGLYIDGRCIYTSVTASTFANNSALDGGAILLRLVTATATFTSSAFLANTATTGAALSAYPGAALAVSNCSFVVAPWQGPRRRLSEQPTS